MSIQASTYSPTFCRAAGGVWARGRREGTFELTVAFTGMPERTDPTRQRAERMFKARQERQADAPKATAEYYAAQEKLRDRTQELRRLRLARAQEKSV